MNEIFDISNAHGGIPEIREHAVEWYFGPETYDMQARVGALWRYSRDALHDRARWSTERLLAWKLDRLRELVDAAFENVPLYREKYGAVGYSKGALRTWADWDRLPSTSRADLIEGFPEHVTSPHYDLSSCRWLTSSGSTGNLVQLVLEPLRADLDQAARWRMFESMARAPLPPDRWVYNINHAHWWVTSMCGEYPTFTVSQRAPAAALLTHIKLLRPSFISGISSAIEGLAAEGADLAALGVLGVSTNSETTLPESRRRWAGIFGVPVLDEYSSEEAGMLAAECPRHEYHLIEDDAHVDVVDADLDGVGQVLTTDLWNRVMPVIRYQQGDLAGPLADGSSCPCGLGGRVLRGGLQGRQDEALMSSARGRIASGILLELTEDELAMSDQFWRYRLLQLAPDTVELVYEVRTGATDDETARVVANFRRRLEAVFGTELDFTHRAVDLLDEAPRLKRKVIVNLMGAVR